MFGVGLAPGSQKAGVSLTFPREPHFLTCGFLSFVVGGGR